MHFVVVDTHRFVKISRHLYCCRRYLFNYLYYLLLYSYCNIYLHF